MRIGGPNLGLLLVASTVFVAGIPAGIAAAHPRQQGDSIADAARRAQAEKKSQPAPQKVWTNEDIPKTSGDISIVGPTAAPSAQDTSSAPPTPAAPANNANKAANTDKKRSAIQSDLDAAKLDLNTVTTDLDILTRKQALDSQTYYGKPNYASDTAGAAALRDEQDEVDAKKQQVADAQKKVNDLQDQLAALSTDSSATSNSSSTNSTSPDSSTGSASTPSSNNSAASSK